jgi:hypothetical protein
VPDKEDPNRSMRPRRYSAGSTGEDGEKRK